MKNGCIVFFLILCLSKSIMAQGKKKAVRKQTNPFEMVHVADSVRNKLYSYLWQERKDSVKAGILIANILGKDKANGYKFVEGVYSFKLMGPHFDLYYFIFTEKDGVQIIKHYDLENLLLEVVSCFKRNLNSFSQEERIAYVQAMIDKLDLRDAANDQKIL